MAFIDLTISVIDSGFLVQIQDITEHKISEEAQKKTERTFKNFFSHILDYAYIVSPEWKLIDVNDAGINELDYEKDELVDKPLSMIYAPESLQKMKHLFLNGKKLEN